jgi:hypothetical protein
MHLLAVGRADDVACCCRLSSYWRVKWVAQDVHGGGGWGGEKRCVLADQVSIRDACLALCFQAVVMHEDPRSTQGNSMMP